MSTCNYNTCIPSQSFPRNYNKGKSFDFGEWNTEKTYRNDSYYQDFVTYKGKLYACVRTNTNVPPPNKRYWTVCVDATLDGDIETSIFITGTEFPDVTDIVENSVYLDLNTNHFYILKDGNWEPYGELSVKSNPEWTEVE